MALSLLLLGTTANDGTGDTLRVAGGKINTAFSQIDANTALLADKTGTGSLVGAILPTFGNTGIKLAGSSSGNTTLLAPAVAGSAVVTLPGVSGTLALLGANVFNGNQRITPATEGSSSFRIDATDGTARFQVGTLSPNSGGSLPYGAIYVGNITPNSTNYVLAAQAGVTNFNSATSLYLCINDTAKVGVTASSVNISQSLSLTFTSNPVSVGDLLLGRKAAASLQLGANHATTATNQTISAHNVTTGTGASLTLAGGTGSAAGGAVILATSATTGAPVARITVAANGEITAVLPTTPGTTGTLWNDAGTVKVA